MFQHKALLFPVKGKLVVDNHIWFGNILKSCLVRKQYDQVARYFKCTQVFKCPPRNGTSALRSHIDRCYKDWCDLIDDKKQQSLSLKNQTVGGSGAQAEEGEEGDDIRQV